MSETQEELMAIHGKIFETHKGRWHARVANHPHPAATDDVCYRIEFRLVEEARPARDLKLWVSNLGLRVERSKKRSEIFDYVKLWRETDSTDGALSAKELGPVFSFSYRPRPVKKRQRRIIAGEPIDRASVGQMPIESNRSFKIVKHQVP